MRVTVLSIQTTMAIGIQKPSALHFTFLTLILLTTTPSPSSSFIIPTPSSFDISGSARIRTLANKIDVGLEIFELVSDINGLMKSWTELSRLESRDERVEWVRRNYGSLLKGSVSLLRLLKVLPHSVDKYMNVIGYHLKFIQEIQNFKVVLMDYLELRNNWCGDLKKHQGVLQLQGPLKDAVEMVQTEIAYGGLLEDFLELGSSDLKGAMQILIDVALQYTSNGKSEL